MELVGSEFLERLDFYHRAWLPARAVVEEAVRRRFEVTLSQPGGSLGFWGRTEGVGRPNPFRTNLPGVSLHPISCMAPASLQEGTLSFWGH